MKTIINEANTTTINQYKKVITVDNHDKLRQSLFISLNENELILPN